jgi:hypothetical protein
VGCSKRRRPVDGATTCYHEGARTGASERQPGSAARAETPANRRKYANYRKRGYSRLPARQAGGSLVRAQYRPYKRPANRPLLLPAAAACFGSWQGLMRLGRSPLRGSLVARLNWRCGSEGVLASFHGLRERWRGRRSADRAPARRRRREIACRGREAGRSTAARLAAWCVSRAAGSSAFPCSERLSCRAPPPACQRCGSAGLPRCGRR